MAQLDRINERRTSVDAVFDHLHEAITTLELRPGDKISEAEVAARFGVSRQPVRDAFSRLANQDLLLIRPQRATVVRRFSLRDVEKSRFVRAAIEAEALRRACRHRDAADVARLRAELERQREAVAARDLKAFGALDYAFHEAICDVARVPFAYEALAAEKAKVDRLCLLSLAKEDRMPDLVLDHEGIVAAIEAGDGSLAVARGMEHLSRLDTTIATIAETNPHYFEPD